MKFIDREAQYLGRKKITKVGQTDNKPIAGEEPFFVNIERAEGIIDEEGTPINAENLNKGNWRDDDSISFKKMDNNVLPNADMSETQIVTTADGKTWLIPPLGLGNAKDITDSVAASVKVDGVKADIEFTSDPQTQINGKANKTHAWTHRVGAPDDIGLANGSMPGLSTNDYSYADKTKVNSLAAVLEVASALQSDAHIRFSKKTLSSGAIANEDVTIRAATTTADGVMTASDKTKLNGIATNADVSTIKTISANGVNAAPDVNKNVNIPAAGPTVSGVTKLYAGTGQNTDGAMHQKAVTDALLSNKDKYYVHSFSANPSSLYKMYISTMAITKSPIPFTVQSLAQYLYNIGCRSASSVYTCSGGLGSSAASTTRIAIGLFSTNGVTLSLSLFADNNVYADTITPGTSIDVVSEIV